MRRRAAVQDGPADSADNADVDANQEAAHAEEPASTSASPSGAQPGASSVQIPFGSSHPAANSNLGRKRPRKSSPVSFARSASRYRNFTSTFSLRKHRHERTPVKCVVGVISVLGVGLLLIVALAGFFGEIYYPVRRADIQKDVGHGHESPVPPQIYAIGLVRDMADVQPDVLRWLAEVNCNHGVGLHIVAGAGGDGDGDGNARKDGLDHYRSRIVDEQSRIPTKEPAAETLQNGKAHSNNSHRELFAGCAPVHIVTEGSDLIYGRNQPRLNNRVDRIAALRDYQRELLRTKYAGDDEGNADGNANAINGGAVIVIDLDLAALSPPQRVMEVARKLSSPEDGTADSSSRKHDDNTSTSPPFPFDAICAAGVTAASKRELWYYDTYATVLWPDTYLHPLQRRLVKHYYDGEDPTLVRSDDRNGNWTQGDIMRYLQTKAEQQSEHGTVDARSCFGGMTIYRASAWFEAKCSYTHGIGVDSGIGSDPSNTANEAAASMGLMRYASEADGRPCEHVVFHDCLIRTNSMMKGGDSSGGSRSRIAIMPKLLTLWRKDKKK